jgi:hypothetical protein
MKSGFSPFYPLSYPFADTQLKLILAIYIRWKQDTSGAGAKNIPHLHFQVQLDILEGHPDGYPWTQSIPINFTYFKITGPDDQPVYTQKLGKPVGSDDCLSLNEPPKAHKGERVITTQDTEVRADPRVSDNPVTNIITGSFGTVIEEPQKIGNATWLKVKTDSGESWSNQNGLSIYGDPICQNIDWLRTPGKQASNGSWYNDPTVTSFAVLTMLN